MKFPKSNPEPIGEVFARRRDYCRLTEADAALLAELRETLESDADRLVDAFYGHLSSEPELQRFLGDEDVVRRLKGFQRAYLLSLTSGDYDDAYAADRTKIGVVHAKIGLMPQWYVGTYGIYLDLLMPLVHRHFGSDDGRAVRASAALTKLLLLDMQLVLDAYYEVRQQKRSERAEQLAAVGELAASIAHEVRNPLAGMQGALQLLRRDLQSPDSQDVMDEVLAQITRLEGIVRDLLTFARPSSPMIQDVELHPLIDRVVRHCCEERAEEIVVDRRYAATATPFRADPQQIEQVLFNLVQNALQAMPEGGTLTLTTRSDDGEMTLSIEDDGAGIPDHVMPEIFQPFFTTRHRGSGLGLSIVRKIVDAHRGSIQVLRGKERGAVATVRLPIDGGI